MDVNVSSCVYAHVCLSVCIQAHVCLHRCMCVCMFMCACAPTQICVYVCACQCQFHHIPVLHSHHAFIYKPLSRHPEYQEIKLLPFSLSLTSWAPIPWHLSFLGAPRSQVVSPPVAGEPHSLFFLLLRCYTRTFPSKGFSITSTPNSCSCDHSIPPWSPHVLLRNYPQGHRFLEIFFPHLVVWATAYSFPSAALQKASSTCM